MLVRLWALTSSSVVVLVTRGEAFIARRRLTCLKCLSISVLLLGWLLKIGVRLDRVLVESLGWTNLLCVRLPALTMSQLKVLDL